MRRFSKIKSIYRIIDANINRAKEGLRVSEEITRFILNNRNLTLRFKKLRHRIEHIIKRLPLQSELLKDRFSQRDVGKNIFINELKRRNYKDIFMANMQRIKESVRVLEEFSKLINKNIALEFKKIRYDIYELEKKAIRKISSLRYYR